MSAKDKTGQKLTKQGERGAEGKFETKTAFDLNLKCEENRSLFSNYSLKEYKKLKARQFIWCLVLDLYVCCVESANTDFDVVNFAEPCTSLPTTHLPISALHENPARIPSPAPRSENAEHRTRVFLRLK